jgi:1-deoxy-D-xylulose-5-phosphate reductoisomerase
VRRPFAAEAAARAAPQPAPNEAKRLVILGATGSIGRSCARVIGESTGRFAVAAVAAGRDGAAPTTVAEALAIHHIARDRAAALLA